MNRYARALFTAAAVLAVALGGQSRSAEPSRPSPIPSEAFSPVVVRPSPSRMPVEPSPTPSRTRTPATPAPRQGATVRATWYCNTTHPEAPASRCTRGHPDGPGADLYAAISPDLARLRGQRVEVCYGGRCVTVRVIDCNCQATNAIDLYADAFVRLAPLSRGRIVVTLRG